MSIRTARLLVAWLPWIFALLIGVLHYVEVSGYNAVHVGLSVPEQKEAWLKTENAFYFSYYEEFVEAPSVSAAFWAAVRDRRSEAPDTINAIHRFNIYQEIICGLLFRFTAAIFGRDHVLDPWYFFRGCSFLLQGLGHVGLVRFAAAIGGDGVLGGVIPGLSLAVMAFIHRMDFSRINDVGMLELRENWAMPIIFCQVWALSQVLRLHPALKTTGSRESSIAFLAWRWYFRILTLLCILVWQFSAFAFLLQVSAVFLCTLLACDAGARVAMTEIVNSHLISCAGAAVLLFGNELLVHHLLVTQCVAIKAILFWKPLPSRWRLLFWLDGALAVGLFLLLRLLQMPFATADTHVWELYADKMRTLFPSYLAQVHREPTFNTRLYNAVSVFDFISWQTIEVGMRTKVYHAAGFALCVQGSAFVCKVLSRAGKTAQDGSKETSTDIATIERDGYAQAFLYGVLIVQTSLWLLLGCFISRLKCIGVPFLLVLAATAMAPKPIETLIGKVSSSQSAFPGALRRLLLATACVAQLGQLTWLSRELPFLPGRAERLHGDKSWPDGDRGEFFNWMFKNIPEDETIITSMVLSAELRLTTPLRVVIHPQFEAQHLRDRVQELYQFYQCTTPASFAKTMRKYNSSYIILEFKRCNFGPFLLDDYPKVNCKEGERPWKDLFCPRALASPLFEKQFANAEFAVLRLLPKHEVPKGAQAGNLEDLSTWQPMLQRCLKEEPEECAARTADLAGAFRKLGQPKIAHVLLEWAEQHGSTDGAFQFIMGHHLDYDLQQSDKAGKYYRRAHELEPNNPVFLREYVMWLDLVAKDNQTLHNVLGPRRHTHGKRLSLLEMGYPPLACEASVTAQELFQDLDWSQELWNFAKDEGPCDQCISNNWPLLSENKTAMKEDLSEWDFLLNVFWRRKVKSTLMSSSGNAGRHAHAGRRPQRIWSLKSIFKH